MGASRSWGGQPFGTVCVEGEGTGGGTRSQEVEVMVTVSLDNIGMLCRLLDSRCLCCEYSCTHIEPRFKGVKSFSLGQSSAEERLSVGNKIAGAVLYKYTHEKSRNPAPNPLL